MTGTWSREQVLALSPDSGSTSAAAKLSGPAPWSDTGADDRAVWGYCKGSGSKPYQTVVDIAGPAYKCSCPSRKFPCKHALGLLLLWADGGVGQAEQPAYVGEWLESRGERAERTAARAASAGPADPAAAAARLAQRSDRVRAGLDDLEVWLRDQVRGGLSALQGSGYVTFEQVAARMVDAQAPGVASMLRAVPARLSGESWPANVLEELAQVWLTVQAHRRLDDLPGDLADTVRARVGYTVSTDSVRASPPVRDRWAVLGSADTVEYRLNTRRSWLRGEASGRYGLLLAFAPPGRPLETPAIPGTTVDADLHFYPGAGQRRALLGTEHSRVAGVAAPPAVSIATAADQYAALVAEDPWAGRLPVVLRGSVGAPEGERWWLREASGDAVPLLTSRGAPWPLLALSMGDEVLLFGEWTREGVVPFACPDVFTTQVVSA